MRVSCLPVSFFPDIAEGRMTLPQWARLAADAGLDGIDVSSMLVRQHTPVYLARLKKDIEAAGLPVVMVVSYPDFSHPVELQRERELQYLRHDIAMASYLGAKYVRILAGQAHGNVSVRDGVAWVVESFKSAASVAERFGVQLLFENHSKPGAWDFVDFSHPTEIFLEIVERTEGSGIGVNFDTANTLVYGDDVVGVLEKIVDRVVTIHAADTARRGHLEPVVLGKGIVPFREIFQLLKQNSFDGWICIEEASRTGADGVRKALEFVRETWKSV